MSRTILFRGLSAAFACFGLAQSAHAVMLDPRGLGQALVFPYYTVNAGQDTLLTVVNTSGVGKAVKVTFREGYNGRETLSFDLFLSAHDSWVGAVSAIDGSAASGARLSSPDHSCVDYIPAFPYPFSSAAYTGGIAGPGGAGYAKDSGPQTIDRTREGFIEMIEIGDIAPGSATDLATTPVQTGNPGEGIAPCNLPLRTRSLKTSSHRPADSPARVRSRTSAKARSTPTSPMRSSASPMRHCAVPCQTRTSPTSAAPSRNRRMA
jgi:hypothetical protein